MTSDDFADASLSVFAGVNVLIATPAEDGTSHPGGIEFIAALGWRGVVYGAADGLLLSAFPILRVFAALRDTRLRRRTGGIVAAGAIAIAASLAMTAVYHAGYSDSRSDKMRKPVTGDLVWSVPTLATLNPIGAPVAHARSSTQPPAEPGSEVHGPLACRLRGVPDGTDECETLRRSCSETNDAMEALVPR